MNQVLRVNNSDPRITYSSGWTTINRRIALSTESGPYTWTSLLDNDFYFLFRGTNVKLYGRGRGTMSMGIDGINEAGLVKLNSTNPDDMQTLVYSSGNMEDGDHQIWGTIETLEKHGVIEVHYFEIENSSGRGFDLLWSGPNATNVPKEALIVDNTSPDIIYNETSWWSHYNDNACYERSVSCSTGASLSYSFNGVAIWYYGSLTPLGGLFTVSIDGSTPQRLSNQESVYLEQRMLWSNTSLGPGSHTLTLKPDQNKELCLDFFRILREEDAPALLSSTLTSTPTALATETQSFAFVDKMNTVPLAVGLTLGLFALVSLVLGVICYLYRKRRRRSINPDAHPAFPYMRTVPKSGWPQYSNHPPQL